MVDERLTKVAEILVDYSVKVKKGDRVLVLSDFIGKPLVTEIYKLCIKRGASEVLLQFDSYDLDEIFFKYASKEQRRKTPAIAKEIIKRIDCWIGVGCTGNTRGLTGVSPDFVSDVAKAHRSITDYRVEKTRWVLVGFPSEAEAQEADMSLGDYEDFVFRAITGVDWKKKAKEQEKLRKLLDKTKDVRIVGKGTDLTFSIEGRKAVSAAGENNMPDGEVFTSVVENSAEGKITFDFPAIYQGREFHNVSLTFKKGRVAKAKADKGEEDLNKILDMDRGARRMGEFGIGNNFAIKKFTKRILFDEKIGGSIHIALGNGYKQTLSKNKSGLHWDMIKDLRKGGKLYFDGRMVQENGVWKI